MSWSNFIPLLLLFRILRSNEVLNANLRDLQDGKNDDLAHLLDKGEATEELSKILEALEKTENSRREHLDSKANSLLSGATIALTALGTGGALLQSLGSRGQPHSAFNEVFPWTLLICAIYWFSALLMVYQSLNVVSFDILCCQSIANLQSQNIKVEIARERYSNALLNEPRLTIKSNWLSGARTLYESGISVLLLSLMLTIALTLWPIFSDEIVGLLPIFKIYAAFSFLIGAVVIIPPLLLFHLLRYVCGRAMPNLKDNDK